MMPKGVEHKAGMTVEQLDASDCENSDDAERR